MNTSNGQRVNDITRYQQACETTATYPGAGTGNVQTGLTYVTMGLAGEAGAICNKVKKILRDCEGFINNKHRAQIADDLGDVLWCAAQVATQMGLDLGQVAADNARKLADRKARGVLQGSGDRR